MTDEVFRQLIDDHARFPAALLQLFQGSPAELLRDREAPGRWSPLEILAHLRDEEKEDFGTRARAAVAGEELTLGLDPDRWVTERRYNEMDPGAVYFDFAQARAESCQWLSTLRLDDLQRSVEHPKLGTFRAGDFIAAWRTHDLLHMRQFATALVVLTARRLRPWKVQYAGRIPEINPAS